MAASIREFGFKVPVLARSSGDIVDGHLRLKAAEKLGLQEIPVILCDDWSEAQVKAFRLLVNRSVTWAEWDEELLAQELGELKGLDFDLSLTGFDDGKSDDFRSVPGVDHDSNVVPPFPEHPVSKVGDLCRLGPHGVLRGNATRSEPVPRVLDPQKPLLMV